MNVYLVKIIINLLIILLQVFLILEIERCWLILKGKKSSTAEKLLQFIELPFTNFIRNERDLRITAMLVYPLLFGIMCAGGIPFLNYFTGTNIILGYPWGYIAMFGAGCLGISIFILMAFLHTKIASNNFSLKKASYLMLIYIALLIISIYLQFKILIV